MLRVAEPAHVNAMYVLHCVVGVRLVKALLSQLAEDLCTLARKTVVGGRKKYGAADGNRVMRAGIKGEAETAT
jgi:hypothetical protein